MAAHLAWREIESSSWDRRSVAHLELCALCRERLLARLLEDMAFPALPEPVASALRAQFTDLMGHAVEANALWPRVDGRSQSPAERLLEARDLGARYRLPLAQLALQEARKAVRDRLLDCRSESEFALGLLEEVEEPSHLVADLRAEAHVYLAETARRSGDLTGWHLSRAREHFEAGTGCRFLEGEIYSAWASYSVDVGAFREGLDQIDQALDGFRGVRRRRAYAVALVKRASILSLLDPEAGVLEARSALRWMSRHGFENEDLETAALRVRLECLVEANRTQEAYRLLNRHADRFFPDAGTHPLPAARTRFLVARLLFQLDLPWEGEATLTEAIGALDTLHPQEAFRARLLMLQHLARERRHDEACAVAQEASRSLMKLQHPNPEAFRTAMFFGLLVTRFSGPLDGRRSALEARSSAPAVDR